MPTNTLTPIGKLMIERVEEVRRLHPRPGSASCSDPLAQCVKALTDLVERLILNDQPLWAVDPDREEPLSPHEGLDAAQAILQTILQHPQLIDNNTVYQATYPILESVIRGRRSTTSTVVGRSLDLAYHHLFALLTDPTFPNELRHQTTIALDHVGRARR